MPHALQLHQSGSYSSIMNVYIVIDNLYLLTLGQLCSWAGSTWLAVGTIDRRSQQKCTVCDAREPSQMIQSILKPVYRWFSTDSLCLRVTQMPKSWDLAIFVPTTDKTDCFNPFTCAQGNIYHDCCILCLLLDGLIRWRWSRPSNLEML